MGRRASVLGALALALASVAGACGGDGGRELVGYPRDPAPRVDAVALPDVSRGGEPFPLRAPAGGLLLVFFGYTNCPDVCPTTLATVASALDGLDDAAAARVELAMVTVDPVRDVDVLAGFVQEFVPSAHALATDDDSALRAVAEPFGVSYDVTTGAGGDVQVAHTGNLFAVDDGGTLALTWPTGVVRDDLRDDLAQLLDGAAA